MPDLLHALVGIVGLVALAWLLSENRRAVPWRAIAAGLGLQVLLGVVFLRFSLVKTVFLKINDALLVLERATQAGTSLVFGYLGGGPAPFAVSDAASNFVLAFRALPIVLLISALSALLFYWGVLPAAAAALSGCPRRRMSSSAWSRRRSSCAHTWGAYRAASCSPSWSAAWRRSPARCCSSTAASSGRRCPTRWRIS